MVGCYQLIIRYISIVNNSMSIVVFNVVTKILGRKRDRQLETFHTLLASLALLPAGPAMHGLPVACDRLPLASLAVVLLATSLLKCVSSGQLILAIAGGRW